MTSKENASSASSSSSALVTASSNSPTSSSFNFEGENYLKMKKGVIVQNGRRGERFFDGTNDELIFG